MITEDEVMGLFERSDPARAADAAPAVDPARYLDALRSNDEVPIVETRLLTLGTRRPRRPRVVSVAAGVAVLIVGVAFLLATRDHSAETVDQAPAATGAPELHRDGTIEVASDFIEAFGRLDLDQVAPFLAPDADVSGLLRLGGASDAEGSVEDLGSLLSLLEAQRYFQVARPWRCDRLATSAAGTIVGCTFDFYLLGADDLGQGPFEGGRFEVTVRDDEIVRASMHWDVAELSLDIWEPFVAWVSAQRPADLAVMYVDSTHREARRTEESTRRWAEHVDDYVATGRAYIDRARAICEAAPAQVPSGSEPYDEAFGRTLQGALSELRAVPPPLPVRAHFDHAYSVAERLADAMLEATSGSAIIDLIHELELLPGMRSCTFYGPR